MITDSESAFKHLKSELKAEINQIKAIAAEEVQNGNLERASKLFEHAKGLQDLEITLANLYKEWKKIGNQPRLPGIKASRQIKIEPAPIGLRTHEKYFRLPILKALVANEGKGSASEITNKVGEMLIDRLNDYDKEKLKNGRTIRWRSTTSFVRLKLVREGLLRDDSPKGTWEVSEAGREYLKIDPA